MNNKGVFIKYGDIAVGAKEEFVPTSQDKTNFTDFSDLKKDISFPNYTNPCDLFSSSLELGLFSSAH